MQSLDQVDEWRRLKHLYARMSEGQLERVAREAYDLTDIAKPLLRDEIASRGLKIPLIMERKRQTVVVAPPDSDFDSSHLGLGFVGPCWKIENARKVKEVLDAAGVPCFWGPDNLESPEGLDFDQGVFVVIPAAEWAVVREAIEQILPREPEPEPYICVCPQCKSSEIIFHALDGTSRFRWSCDTCGHAWEDDGIEKER